MAQNTTSGEPAAAGTLTPEQLQGLAQLGALVNTLSAALGNGAGGAAAGTLRWAGDLYERYELPEVLEEVLATFKVMRDSGLLALARNNAESIVQTITLIEPLVPKLLEAARDVPLDRWQRHLATLDRLLTQLQALSEFVETRLAGELTGALVNLTALAQETEAEATLAEVLRALSGMRKNGTLQWLLDLSDHAMAFSETADTAALVGDQVRKADGGALVNGLVQALRATQLLSKAIDAAREPPPAGKGGGFAGLIRLLRDGDVQQSLRLAGRVTAELKKADGGSLTAD